MKAYATGKNGITSCLPTIRQELFTSLFLTRYMFGFSTMWACARRIQVLDHQDKLLPARTRF